MLRIQGFASPQGLTNILFVNGEGLVTARKHRLANHRIDMRAFPKPYRFATSTHKTCIEAISRPMGRFSNHA
jgi:hypothetical protein